MPLSVSARDVVFFNCNVPYSTELNISNRPRAAVVYHFVSSEVYKERQFSIPEGAEYSTPVIWGPESDMEMVAYKQEKWNDYCELFKCCRSEVFSKFKYSYCLN